MVGCPILRALCEGWDKQNVRGKGLGAVQSYPTLRKEREGWGTRPLEGATTTLGRGGSDYTTRSWGWQKQGPGQRAAGPY
jgi:hypothetical protein